MKPRSAIGGTLFFIPILIINLGHGVAGCVAATAVFAHMEGLPYSKEILGNGAIGGLVITAIYYIWINLAVLASRMRNSMERSRGVLQKRLDGPVSVSLQFWLTCARTLLTALTLIPRLHLQSTNLQMLPF